MNRSLRSRHEFVKPQDDRLAGAIQKAIEELEAAGAIEAETEDGLRDPRRFEGYCARAVQAYWRFATRDPEYSYLANDPDVEPFRNPDRGHYWIRIRSTGQILDLNLGPTDKPYSRMYRRAVPVRSFQPNPAGSNVPHRNDARLIMERVRRNERPKSAVGSAEAG